MSGKQRGKMGILEWLSQKYFGKRTENDTEPSEPSDNVFFNYQSKNPYAHKHCINVCKHAAIITKGYYYCLVDGRALKHNSVIDICKNFAARDELGGNM